LIDFTDVLFAVVVISSASTTVKQLLIVVSMGSDSSKLCSVEWTEFEFPIFHGKFKACRQRPFYVPRLELIRRLVLMIPQNFFELLTTLQRLITSLPVLVVVSFLLFSLIVLLQVHSPQRNRLLSRPKVWRRQGRQHADGH